MKLFSKALLATATISLASFASAASVSGTTDFRVTLPEILVLYHWDDAHLILTSENYTANDPTTREGTQVLADAHTLNTDVDTSKYTNRATTDTIAVTLKNSWAVRSLSSAPVTLALTNPNATLKNITDNASTIITKEAVLTSNGANVTGSGNANIAIPSGWTPVMGDINFDLDLSNANNSGEYNTRGVTGPAANSENGTDTFLLTLTGNAAP